MKSGCALKNKLNVAIDIVHLIFTAWNDLSSKNV